MKVSRLYSTHARIAYGSMNFRMIGALRQVEKWKEELRMLPQFWQRHPNNLDLKSLV